MLSDNTSIALKDLIQSQKFDAAKSLLNDHFEFQNQSTDFINKQLNVINIENIEPREWFSSIVKPLILKNSKLTRTLFVIIISFVLISLLVTIILSSKIRYELIGLLIVSFIYLLLLIKSIFDQKTKLIVDPNYIEITHYASSRIKKKDILSVFIKTRNQCQDEELILFKKDTEKPEVWNIYDLELTGIEIGYKINQIFNSVRS